ncbi:MAG: S41 family peptidase [Gemmataceae bacterium]
MHPFLVLMLWSIFLLSQEPMAPLKATSPLATQIHSLIEQILLQYHRPVSAETLYLAVCVRMYTLAGQPVPRSLRDEVRQACAANAGPDQRRLLLAAVQQRTLDRLPFVPQLPLVALADALTAELDPYSGLVTAKEMRRAAQQDSDTYGIGVEWQEESPEGTWKVQSVALGSPAQRAGLRPGDWLLRVNGQPVSKTTPLVREALQPQSAEQIPQLLGEEPQEAVAQRQPQRLELELRRGEGPSRRVTLQPERHRPEVVLGTRRLMGNRWSFWLDEKDRLAYIRLGQLRRGAAEELHEQLRTLKLCGVQGLILDLRWAPGGYLNEAVEVADLFLGDRVLATVRMRQRDDTVYRGNDSPIFDNLPVVLLVNGDTQGGAELIAAALQDHGRAIVVGQRTRGKATIQTPLGLGHEQFSFKVTSGTFVRPSGKNLHRHPGSGPRDDWGVRPEVDCRVSPELSSKLREEWLLWSLRPVEESVRLALDDPTYDMQKNEAWKVLRQRVTQADPKNKK